MKRPTPEQLPEATITDAPQDGRYDQDGEALDDYQVYLAEHNAYRASGGILYADDYRTWLALDPRGKTHRERIDAEVGP